LGYYYHSSDRDKEDCYKIEVTENGEAVFTLNSEETLTFYWINLYSKNSDGELAGRGDKHLSYKVAENEVFTISDLAKGTYYIKLTYGGGYGGYSLKYVFNKSTYTTDTEPNNSYEEVKQTLINGETLQGHLGYYYHSSDTDKEDWYKIEVTENGEAVFTLNSEENLTFYWINLHSMDSNGKLAGRGDKHLGYKAAKNEVLTISDLAKGTYYIQVTYGGGYGGYSLQYAFNKNTFTNDTEPNNSYEEANQTILDGQTIQGHLGYYYHSSDTDKEDWYKVEVTKKGEAMFVLNSEESLKFYWINLHSKNSDGKLVQKASMSLGYEFANNKVFKVSNLDKGTYYIQVIYGGGYGGYTLSYDLSSNIDSPEAVYVSVYPNPSQDVFYIQILDKYQYDYLQVLSVDGKLLFTQNCLNSDDNIKIDLTNYPSGIYLINFIGRNTSDFIKLVKE
jgi:hypothetical protein